MAGAPHEVERLLRAWLEEPVAEPLTVATSGSTGAPKLVALSAKALRASGAAGLSRLGGPGHWVLALPAHYVAGVQVICRSILSDTSPVVLADYPDLPAATAALDGDRRYLAAVPTRLHRWLAAAADVAALREYDAVLLGGAAARPALLGKAAQLGIRVVTSYGMTETCGGCVYDGVALDRVAVALGAAGHIRLTGPMLFDGYVGRPDLTASVLRDGWLHTPDLGRFDDDGRLKVIGRGDEVVVSGGVNIALPAVEERL
ncbi:MAG: AMP-binding protein, partial [Actinomycetota bacterium]|nr:AMP-binding protein [Actinomycetota bacterium]